MENVIYEVKKGKESLGKFKNLHHALEQAKRQTDSSPNINIKAGKIEFPESDICIEKLCVYYKNSEFRKTEVYKAEHIIHVLGRNNG